jgi:hypothetical protein
MPGSTALGMYRMVPSRSGGMNSEPSRWKAGMVVRTRRTLTATVALAWRTTKRQGRS